MQMKFPPVRENLLCKTFHCVCHLWILWLSFKPAALFSLLAIHVLRNLFLNIMSMLQRHETKQNPVIYLQLTTCIDPITH